MNSLILIYALATNSNNLPQGLIDAVCYTETRNRPHLIHIDDGGENSYGLCQIHLSTATEMGYDGSGKDLLNPAVNVYYSAKYLKYQLNRYNGDIAKAVAAYNAGSYRQSKVSKLARNQKYVDRAFFNWGRDR